MHQILDPLRRSPYRPAASGNAAYRGLKEDRTRSNAKTGSEISCITGGNQRRPHVGLDPGLVDEDQALGIKPMLVRPPARPEPRDLRAHLLAGHQGLFLTVWPSRLTNRHTVSCATSTPRPASSTVSARIVKSGFSASRARSQLPASPARTRGAVTANLARNLPATGALTLADPHG